MTTLKLCQSGAVLNLEIMCVEHFNGNIVEPIPCHFLCPNAIFVKEASFASVSLGFMLKDTLIFLSILSENVECKEFCRYIRHLQFVQFHDDNILSKVFRGLLQSFNC